MAEKKLLTRRNILIGLVALLILMQFKRIDKTMPPIEEAKTFLNYADAPLQVQRVLKDACYDCHSYETKYPWYTNVAPVSIWIGGHIKNGRQQVNYSIWGDYTPSKQKHKIEESIEVLEQKRMPPKSYKWMHPKAKMSDKDLSALLAWFKSL